MRFSTRLLFLAFISALVMIVAPASFAQAHQADPPPFELSFPQEVDKTTFHNDWGDRRSGGRGHTGTDLMATEKMVEVYAAADGVVGRIDETRRPGRHLYIDHGGGWETLYIHLNDDNFGTDDGDAPWYLTLAPGIESGVEVKAGQLIGWAGDSGNAEGASPHTHFELQYNGQSINPYPYLNSAFERDLADYLRLKQLLINQMLGSLLII
jgi:murein DD-endopeptidase MepM/ murein hydrolase activator NlpD